VLWTPDDLRDDPVGWLADPVFRSDMPQPPPPPPPDAAGWLVAGLRRLFDPQHRLPCPEWLDTLLSEASP